MACAVNADVGFERERTHAYDPVDAPLRVLVAGGGPAGLEAARVAATRGHAVTLVEAASSLGGSLVGAAAAPHRDPIGDIVRWLEMQLEQLGVDVRVDTVADAELVAATNPDVVVVATGAVEGSHRDLGDLLSTTAAAVMADAAAARPLPTGSVVVVDHAGTYEAIGVAERLALEGAQVTLVSPSRLLAPKAQVELVVGPAIERLRAKGVELRLGVDLAEEGPANADEGLRLDDGTTVAATTVVVVERRAAPLALEGYDGQVVVVGDAEEPANVWHAIRTGNAAGRRL
jgi:NADPH-dependent 2,4-dienoyl-CoA reductase/sulfur reductase-like enzyme